jgi:hypothetical protein
MTILFGGDLGMAPRILASRRFRDLMRGHEEEFGNLTVGDQSLIRTAALLALKCEEMQSAVVRGESPAKAYRTYELTSPMENPYSR